MQTSEQLQGNPRNLDPRVVEGFGDEWTRFDQKGASEEDLDAWFEKYFRVFPWESLPKHAVGMDLGCGSGRWARYVARRSNVSTLHCVDASTAALDVARRNLDGHGACVFHHASVDAIPLPDASLDFCYSLGVLHHVPDTAAGIAACARTLKKGAPFLVYLYYAFDHSPAWFRAIWQASDQVRRRVSALPMPLRYATSQALAATVYWPLARTARVLDRVGVNVKHVPLSAYRDSSFYQMRTDALDRFGTTLEQRFTQVQIRSMMEAAGLERITFSDGVPHWCAVGYKA
jgi:ubiquinone/menaquinone biosynthesis C-methylase UbiE